MKNCADRHIPYSMVIDARAEQLKLLSDVQEATRWTLGRISKESGIDSSSLYRFVNKDNKDDGLNTLSAGNFAKLTTLHKKHCMPPERVNEVVVAEAYNLFRDIISRRKNLTFAQEAEFLALLQNTISAELEKDGKASLSPSTAEMLLDNAVLRESKSKRPGAQ